MASGLAGKREQEDKSSQDKCGDAAHTMSLWDPTYLPFTSCLAREKGHIRFVGWAEGNTSVDVFMCFFLGQLEISWLRVLLRGSNG